MALDPPVEAEELDPTNPPVDEVALEPVVAMVPVVELLVLAAVAEEEWLPPAVAAALVDVEFPDPEHAATASSEANAMLANGMTLERGTGILL